MSHDVAALVALLCARVTDLVAREPVVDAGVGAQVHADLRTAIGQLQAFSARVLARVEAQGHWSNGSARTFPDWVARQELASTGSVRREVALGRALDESLPATAEAVAKGAVSVEHAEVLARAASSSEQRRAALSGADPLLNEAALLVKAQQMPVDRYRREVDRWATQVDSATAEAEHEAASAKEYLSLARKGDGVALQGFLTVEHAAVVATALRAVAGVPARTDLRSREERQAHALVDGCRLVLDRGLAGSGQHVRPHLLVHVPVETLRAVETGEQSFDGLPPARLESGEPLPPSTLTRLVCDGELTRIVLGADGAPLDVGRAKRTYSGPQRLAVVARDGSCRFPGCGAPLTLGEVHHVVPWSAGGATSVHNGVLLCWFHHEQVHRRGLRISRVAAGWEFRRANGSLIEAGALAPGARHAAGGGAGPPGWLDGTGPGGTVEHDELVLA